MQCCKNQSEIKLVLSSCWRERRGATHAMTRLYILNNENLSRGMRGTLMTAKLQLYVVVFNSLASSFVTLASKLFLGHSGGSSLSHGGPFHQRSWWISSDGNIPREAQSAGLSLLTTWPQQLAGTSSIIWETRFPTYTLKRRGFPWIQADNGGVCPCEHRTQG